MWGPVWALPALVDVGHFALLHSYSTRTEPFWPGFGGQYAYVTYTRPLDCVRACTCTMCRVCWPAIAAGRLADPHVDPTSAHPEYSRPMGSFGGKHKGHVCA